MYLKERVIIGGVWLICVVSLFFIPKDKRREASVIFLIAHVFAWISGLVVVEIGLIEYPVRELHKANSTSFSFEYLVFPLLNIFFNIHYPEGKSLIKRLLYYTSILSIFTFFEYLTERNTLILKYIHWNWYCTFISMLAVIYITRVLYKCCYNMKKPLAL
jgi:hypothetical protein